MMGVDVVWRRLVIGHVEVVLSKVLRCGQTFRWKNIDNVWTFTTNDKIVLLKQDEESIYYSFIGAKGKTKTLAVLEKETLEFVKDYFNLSIKLEDLYKEWADKHREFRNRLIKQSPFSEYKGIRILRQDPWETVVSFICSSNNNVKRISKMCDAICTEYGTYINDFGGIRHFSFPSSKVLCSSPSVETRLRELGFGYRAKFIYQTALKIEDEANPDLSLEKLYQLRNQDYDTARSFLLQLTGVGPKVADCICLMALDKHNVVPVDTHVYQIAIRDYKFKGLKTLKTMNPKVYQDIGTFFNKVFGPFAGWAQSVLFASDLSDLNNGINTVKAEETESEVVIKRDNEEAFTVNKRSRVLVQ